MESGAVMNGAGDIQGVLQHTMSNASPPETLIHLCHGAAVDVYDKIHQLDGHTV